MGLFDLFTKRAKKEILLSQRITKRFYADYPEKPYISEDRSESWIEQAEMFPKTALVQKKMMKRYADGLLPGHVYMLYWLKKYTNKKVPAYFEYKYGVCFEKEKYFLSSNGFLDENNKPTPKGEAAIKKHAKVIENHSPIQDNSIEGLSKQTTAQLNSIRRNKFKEYEYIAGRDCCEVCAKLDGKHFSVDELKIGINAPPMHENCACSIAAYSDDQEYEEWLEAIANRKKSKRW